MENPIRIPYNSQRDNRTVAGIKGSSQCGYTSSSMMLSKFLPQAGTDDFVVSLIQKMEPAFAKSPISDRILDRLPWARGKRLGMFGDAYAIAIGEILKEYKIAAELVWIPSGGTPQQLEAAISQGSPAMLSTMISPSGHYICVVGFDRDHWICHDPYGNGQSGYAKGLSGENVLYPRLWLEERARKADTQKNGLRFMYIRARNSSPKPTV